MGWRRGRRRGETGYGGVDREENVKRGSQKEQEHLKECRGQVAVVARKAQRCCILSELGHEQQTR